MSYLVDLPVSIGKNVVLPGLSYGANYATRKAAPVVGGVVDAVTNPNNLKTAGNFLQETLRILSLSKMAWRTTLKIKATRTK